ncbi:MAG: hypothetical protein VB934_08600 [Polyangiaceae bacterium]
MTRKDDSSPAARPGRTVVRRELRRVARAFADELLSTLDDLGVFDPEARTPARAKRVRRSDHNLDELSVRIIALMNHYGEALAISDIAAGLELSKRDIAHPMAQLVAAEKLVQIGERRGVRYVVPTKSPRKAAVGPRRTRHKKPRAKAPEAKKPSTTKATARKPTARKPSTRKPSSRGASAKKRRR